jgi:hypothetical protein
VQLRRRLQFQAETVSDFHIASSEKFREGLLLLSAGYPGAGIYLMGYAAEMSLKLSAFIFDGASPADPVFPKLAAAKSWAVNHGISDPPEGYHSLNFWTAYLRRRRLSAGRRLPSDLDGALIRHADRIYSGWWIEMRYRPDAATVLDGERVSKSVTWIVRHRLQLAR